MPPWTDLQIPDIDSDIGALHSAIDEQRTKRKMSWKSVAQEVSRAGERYDQEFVLAADTPPQPRAFLLMNSD